jgi:hypothetical protein
MNKQTLTLLAFAVAALACSGNPEPIPSVRPAVPVAEPVQGVATIKRDLTSPFIWPDVDLFTNNFVWQGFDNLGTNCFASSFWPCLSDGNDGTGIWTPNLTQAFGVIPTFGFGWYHALPSGYYGYSDGVPPGCWINAAHIGVNYYPLDYGLRDTFSIGINYPRAAYQQSAPFTSPRNVTETQNHVFDFSFPGPMDGGNPIFSDGNQATISLHLLSASTSRFIAYDMSATEDYSCLQNLPPTVTWNLDPYNCTSNCSQGGRYAQITWSDQNVQGSPFWLFNEIDRSVGGAFTQVWRQTVHGGYTTNDRSVPAVGSSGLVYRSVVGNSYGSQSASASNAAFAWPLGLKIQYYGGGPSVIATWNVNSTAAGTTLYRSTGAGANCLNLPNGPNNSWDTTGQYFTPITVGTGVGSVVFNPNGAAYYCYCVVPTGASPSTCTTYADGAGHVYGYTQSSFNW